jgi:2-dehydro-3-deoxy-D-arabinonate dehydratase
MDGYRSAVVPGIFRVILPDGTTRLARGEPRAGPRHLLSEDFSLDDLIAHGTLASAASDAQPSDPVPPDARVGAPVGSQEIWAAGVTYLRSREARVEEASDPTPYHLVYEAERPELFFKSAGWRARGPGEAIAVRADSTWNVPEPELALVLDRAMNVVAYTLGNDVSSRSIEGENLLYLPQAKIYDGSCALGPCLVPASAVVPPFTIGLEVVRAGGTAFRAETSTDRMRRSFEELATYLGRELTFPAGAILLTGTGIVPDLPFTLLAGDVVRITADGLGTLENAVEAAGGVDRPGGAGRHRRHR